MNAPLDIRNQIDVLCDAFDRDWSGHSPGAILELLEHLSGEYRSQLLRELVQIDHERCQASGRILAVKDYRPYFPDDAAAIDELICKAESADRQHEGTLPHVNNGGLKSFADICSGENIGVYRLEERLGEGGMGVVYKAVHEELGRAVALKILAFPLNEAISRFQFEASTIAGLNHPHIVQIFETGQHNERPYLVLELMHGGSLDDLLRRELPSAKRAAEIVVQLADAVAAAHRLGIIHRDLKPANVLMDLNGNAKLADFGLARNLNADSQTLSGTLLGTPGFMSPEQTTGDEACGTMDIYGLGAILYAALTGRPPFRGANIPDTLTMVREREPVSVRTLVPSVPVDLESVCLKCLHKNPSGRYATADQLVAELQAFLEGRPVQARPPGRMEKFGRWCHRNPTVATLSGVIVMVVIMGIAGVVSQWRRAEANALRFQQTATLAQKETLRAEEQTETTEAVNQFMRDILEAPQSSRLGRNVSVHDAMDEAFARIDEAFADRPKIAAAIRESLGETYRSLGEANRSIEQFRLALATCKQEFGDSDERTLQAMDSLAGALRSLGDPAVDRHEAVELREIILRERTKTLGEKHPQTISAMNNLATVYMALGELDQAAELCTKALLLHRQQPDLDVPETVMIRFNLASIDWKKGNLEAAELAVRDVVQALSKQVGHFGYAEVELLNAQNTLAGILHDQGRLQESESLYRTVLPERQALVGRDHPHTLSTHRRLTRLLCETGAFEAALPLLHQCLDVHNGKFGEGAGLTFEVRKSVFSALVGLGRNDAAETFLQETTDVLAETRGTEHRYTLQARTMLDKFRSSRQNDSTTPMFRRHGWHTD